MRLITASAHGKYTDFQIYFGRALSFVGAHQCLSSEKRTIVYEEKMTFIFGFVIFRSTNSDYFENREQTFTTKKCD